MSSEPLEERKEMSEETYSTAAAKSSQRFLHRRYTQNTNTTTLRFLYLVISVTNNRTFPIFSHQCKNRAGVFAPPG